MKTCSDDVRKNYNYTVLPEETFKGYQNRVIAAAEKAASETGMSTANLEKLLQKDMPYKPAMVADAKGVGEYLAWQVNKVNGVPGPTLEYNDMMVDVDKTAEANQKISEKIKKFWDEEVRTTQQQKFQYAWGQSAIDQLANGADLGKYGLGFEKFSLGENLDEEIASQLDAMLTNALKGMKKAVGHMDFAGYTIETQEDAQMALDAIEAAIISKDKIRASLGATQNRLENTITNLNVMAENLQAAESRISDVDIATEMTNMVRNQILSQAATAMLAQANSLPQMAMQLIGG